MKKLYTFLIVALCVFNSNAIFAQVWGDNIFLPGHWAELGIAPNGAYGSTTSNLPPGYYPRSPTLTFRDPATGISTSTNQRIALVYDFGHDGWAVGAPFPYYGDYQLPGTPYEGWSIEINGTSGNAWDQLYQGGGTGYSGGLAMTGVNVSYSNIGGVLTGIWQGTAGPSMAITQTTTLDTNGSAIVVKVKMVNTGATTLNNIFYMRSLDPDNDDMTGGGFSTTNVIDYQNDFYHRVMVHATGLTRTNAYLGLATKDCRAKCFSTQFGSWPSFSGYASAQYYAGTVGGTAIYTGSVTGDNAMGLVFSLGNLLAGDSTVIAYAYTYFNGAYGLDTILTDPAMVVNGVAYDSIDTVTSCSFAGDSLPVNIIRGEDNNWSFAHWWWTPTTGLLSDTGVNNKIAISALAGITTFTITGSDSILGNCESKTFLLTIVPTFSLIPAPTVHDTSYCQGAIAVPLTAGGVGLLWYTTGTGGVGSPIAPTPSTATVGTTTYWVTQTIAGCQSPRDSITVTITNPTPISGPTSTCLGHPVTLTDAGVGTWSSGTTAVATIGSTTGIVTPVSAGTTMISYGVGSGCVSLYSFTVNPTPTAITGPTSLCSGRTITMTDATGGGTWTCSPPATIGSLSGIVTGGTAGVTIITYTAADGCYTTTPVTINTSPATISGDSSICKGNETTLTDVPGPGTWSSSASGTALVLGPGGIILGVGVGTATITYMVTASGCYTTTTATVNPSPSPISGPTAVCVDSTITLSDGTGGGTWSTTSTSITLNPTFGYVTGVAAGTATISYTIGGGCYVTYTVTVNGVPAPIAGATPMCAGTTILFGDATLGGTWSSGNPGIATVTAGGMVTGVSYGDDSIYYSLGTGCGVLELIHVDSMPDAIFGPTAVCAGDSVTLTDGTPGGLWSSSNPGIARINATTGVITGISSGSVTVVYTSGSGCAKSITFNVNGLPGPILGGVAVCLNATVNLSDSVTGGTWSTTSGGTIASVGLLTGVITGNAVGPDMITYTLGSGCSVTESFTVNPLPANIVAAPVCVTEGTTTVTDPTIGGTWSVSGITGTATISTTGVLGGLTAGLIGITYTLPGTGCYITTTDVVNGLPDPIAGIPNICIGNTTTLTDASGGGTWSSSATGVATIGSGSGIITTVSAGSTTISYILPTGCYITMNETVNPLPSAIYGTDSVCVNAQADLFDATAGGTWSASNGTASVTASGIVTGIATGIDSIFYTLSATGCSDTISVYVKPIPAPITGVMVECGGHSATLSDITPGGTWSNSPTTIAVISAGGVVTGITGGYSTITYTAPNRCYITAMDTVSRTPDRIIGPTSVCADFTISLFEAMGGGTWTSSNVAIATITPTGIVTGITSGTTIFTYSEGSGCIVVDTIVVNPLLVPAVVIGGTPSVNICAGTPVTYTITTVNGGPTPTFMWSVNSIFVATGNTYAYIPSAGDVVNVQMTSDAVCAHPPVVDYSLRMNILPIVTPGVTVNLTGHGDTVCLGTAVTFTATPQNGGPVPSYQWYVNNVPMGTDSVDYTYVPANGDVISCRLLSDSLCTSPDTATNSVQVIVSPYMSPLVNILTPNPVCFGVLDTLYAQPFYAGNYPQYWWTVNGVSEGSGNPLLYVPSNDDTVICTMVSDYPCILGSDTAKREMVMYIDPMNLPVLTVTKLGGYIVYPGAPDTFYATIISGGGTYPTYQWFVNMVPVTGATTSVFISRAVGALGEKDSVDCEVTNNDVCNGITGFNYYNVIVGVNVGTPILSAGNNLLQIIPNPNKGKFIIRGNLAINGDEELKLMITDILGQVVFKGSVTAKNGVIDNEIQMGSSLANGVYLLNVTSEHVQGVFHLVLDK